MSEFTNDLARISIAIILCVRQSKELGYWNMTIKQTR